MVLETLVLRAWGQICATMWTKSIDTDASELYGSVCHSRRHTRFRWYLVSSTRTIPKVDKWSETALAPFPILLQFWHPQIFVRIFCLFLRKNRISSSCATRFEMCIQCRMVQLTQLIITLHYTYFSGARTLKIYCLTLVNNMMS